MMRVLGDRVLVLLPAKVHAQDEATGYTFQQGHSTDSGIVLAKPADVYNDHVASRGIVMQVGEKTETVDLDSVLAILDALDDETSVSAVRNRMAALAPASFDVQPGDCVLFASSAGDQFDLDGHSYVILHESEIHAVVDPLHEAA